MKYSLKNIRLSLFDLLGETYVEAVCKAKAFLEQKDKSYYLDIAREEVEFFPSSFQKRLNDLIAMTGQKVTDGLPSSPGGAGTDAFRKATRTSMSPLSALGVTRIGENGHAYLIAKSEHYHAPLGHSFPGYRLVDNAVRLGIPNATHNNTRGYITRLLETELVRVANGIPKEDHRRLQEIISSEDPHVLNRVINLETGSLAVEAALKMMLMRFVRLDKTYAQPLYAGKTPVFLVIADNDGGAEANYHGTTILAQIFRDMWPDLYHGMEKNDLFRIIPLRINDADHFDRMITEYDRGPYKVAGFIHEIVLMNYGGIVLQKKYLRHAYEICHERDIPVLVDEIQSCIWSPDFFLFKEYGLNPDFVSIGKGFAGGQYPASKILTTPAMDGLNLFGALVTNGQEELASLTYLITMTFAEENNEYIEELGSYYEKRVRELAKRYSNFISRVEGIRHMTTLFFRTVEDAVNFTSYLGKKGIDISTQTYKAHVPPSALTKIPLIATPQMVDFIVGKMEEALRQLKPKRKTVQDDSF